jgi:tetratricopeptide (TPR) repeat protein
MSLKDIEKLKERVDKDPNSKLFVPLAEEYKKEGMLEDAINVLLGGIERQPGYMSARVSLGKIYLEKGMMNEARAEFEDVIKSIPDNLYAHKKLAEIYRDLGEKALSINSYKAVLKLNAQDDDAISNLRDLEGEEGPEPVEKGPEAKEGRDAGYPSFKEDIEEPAPEEIEIDVAPVPERTPPPLTEDELNAFKDSLFGDKAAAAVQSTEKTSDADEEEAIEIVEEDTSVDEISFEDVNEAIVVDAPRFANVAAEPEEDSSAKSFKGEEIAESVSPVPSAEDAGLGDADSFITEGNYLGAINVYRSMLSSTPDNKAVMQRMEELKVLLKLMGKDKETLITRLDEFLEGIRKRRDEFHRSS